MQVWEWVGEGSGLVRGLGCCLRDWCGGARTLYPGWCGFEVKNGDGRGDLALFGYTT
jgi:hypothetical protein